MGYTTKFKGVLKFQNEVTVEELKHIQTLLGENIPDGSYCQFELTKNMEGIQWDGSEKFYDADQAAQWVIDEMRERFPGFGLLGDLMAQGEDMDDRWILRCTGDKAEKIDNPPPREKIRCPHCRHDFYWEAKK